MTNQTEKILFDKETIEKRVKELALQISKDYKGKEVILVAILKGAIVFLSDLMRDLSIPVTVDFIQAFSYGASTTSSGTIEIKKDMDMDIAGKHVLIVEDIIDCGYTLDYIRKLLEKRKPASLKICCFLDKVSRRKVEVPLAYKGFEVPDKFVVGYGLDFAEKYRNLPYVATLISNPSPQL